MSPALSRRRLLGGLAVLPVLAGPALARVPEICTENGLALRGIDAVAYWTEGRAVAGQPAYALMWRGATWLFSSPETMLAFEMNPAGYAPAYGGWCAFAMAHAQITPSAPTAFALWEGRLFLAASARVLAAWDTDRAALVAAADARWPVILG